MNTGKIESTCTENLYSQTYLTQASGEAQQIISRLVERSRALEQCGKRLVLAFDLDGTLSTVGRGVHPLLCRVINNLPERVLVSLISGRRISTIHTLICDMLPKRHLLAFGSGGCEFSQGVGASKARVITRVFNVSPEDRKLLARCHQRFISAGFVPFSDARNRDILTFTVSENQKTSAKAVLGEFPELEYYFIPVQDIVNQSEHALSEHALFITISGNNKRNALISVLKNTCGLARESIHLVAFGNGPNDIPLLEEADSPYYVSPRAFSSSTAIPALVNMPYGSHGVIAGLVDWSNRS